MSLYKASIDWPGLTHCWNPFYGCKRGCDYCYANELHNKRKEALKNGKRLPDQYKKPFNEIQYFPERLDIVKKSTVVKRVFVGDMSDVFYCKKEFLRDTMEKIIYRPKMEFMFLTKSPEVYQNNYFHENCWLGVTATSNKDKDKLLYMLTATGTKYKRMFVSIEPLLGDCSELPLSLFNLVIVGAMTGPNAIRPKKEWIKSIRHKNVYYKNKGYITKQMY